jgi:hypothetical protein
MEKFYKKRIILMSISNKIFFATKNIGVPEMGRVKKLMRIFISIRVYVCRIIYNCAKNI